jgi:exodeoxyribonuclease V alpha subunit
VVVPVLPSPLLDRTLLYTAITRSVEQVVLLGNREAFERAVAAPPAPMRRQTGLGFLIQGLRPKEFVMGSW